MLQTFLLFCQGIRFGQFKRIWTTCKFSFLNIFACIIIIIIIIVSCLWMIDRPNWPEGYVIHPMSLDNRQPMKWAARTEWYCKILFYCTNIIILLFIYILYYISHHINACTITSYYAHIIKTYIVNVTIIIINKFEQPAN